MPSFTKPYTICHNNLVNKRFGNCKGIANFIEIFTVYKSNGKSNGKFANLYKKSAKLETRNNCSNKNVA